MLALIKKSQWNNIILLLFLLLLELGIQPLTAGPDRRIHDPAVYRLDNPNYMPGDWYTEMTVESRIYIFYSKLINFSNIIRIPEESWRQFLYIASLVVVYYSMIKIARLFLKNFLVVPIVVIFHALFIKTIPPEWMYGSFIQIDGGLAPRSLGVALSFLALYFLLKKPRIIPWVLLGMATLIHVSNSLVIFTLFCAAWIFEQLVIENKHNLSYLFDVFKRAILSFVIYLFAGGWFALFVAIAGGHTDVEFSPIKFIWTWIYFRAPYMALPLVSLKAWILFFIHLTAIIIGWCFLRKFIDKINRKNLGLMALVGLGAALYLYIFYLFSSVFPWIPGFQFYSIRTIYFTYFIAYIFGSLLIIYSASFLIERISEKAIVKKCFLPSLILLIIGFIILPFSSPSKDFVKNIPKNLKTSLLVVLNKQPEDPQLETTEYLELNPTPFLAPPDWYGSPYYLPSVANFKCFGFTPRGLEQWFKRLDDVSQGKLEEIYEEQKNAGKFAPALIDWRNVYSNLSIEQIHLLSEKYNFNIFLTYKNKNYPFQLIAEDKKFRLYKLD